MVYKSLHGLAPEYLSSRFAIRETAYNLIDSENTLCIPLVRTYYYKNSLSCSGAFYGCIILLLSSGNGYSFQQV